MFALIDIYVMFTILLSMNNGKLSYSVGTMLSSVFFMFLHVFHHGIYDGIFLFFSTISMSNFQYKEIFSNRIYDFHNIYLLYFFLVFLACFFIMFSLFCLFRVSC